MKSARLLLALSGAAAVAACVPRSEPPPPPPQPRPAQPRPTPPPPPPPAADWRDVAITPGGWVYSAQGNVTQALFGPANSEAHFIVRCDRSSNRIALVRQGVGSGDMMTIRTTFGARNFPVTARREPLALSTAIVAASDRFLDGMAFSRGRFTVELPGTPMLVIPSWPEPARVIEDCRG